jgi:hypothetical protein
MTDIVNHINYPKVVYIQLEKWRVAREPILKKLDVEFFMALETNDTEKIVEIAAKKQALRNITTYDFSNVEQLDDILEIWPEILGPKI